MHFYDFNWYGKEEAKKEAETKTEKAFRYVQEESLDTESTENMFIEGDSLDALKILQESHVGKIKMIYIDPPYNTGKKFIYNDNFRYSKREWKFITGRDCNGRLHVKWLNMMYPRLKLARNLLRDDGVIFISIDDHEVANLRKVCDEIFGEENFIANIIWQRAFSPKNDAKYFSNSHDHLLIYSKNIATFIPGRLDRSLEQDRRYTNPDNDPRGPWISGDLSVRRYSEKSNYPIETPSGRKVYPTHGSCWRISKEKFNELEIDGRIWFGLDGSSVPRLKRFLSEVREGIVPVTLWLSKEVGHNQEAHQELKQLFDGKAYFDAPKPLRFLKKILKVSNTIREDVILDFFAGSSSTAHAVIDLNKEDRGNRKFIMVQLPEPCNEKSEAYKAGYENIAELGKARIRRVAKKIKEEKPEYQGDLGFKVFKIENPSDNDVSEDMR